MRITALLLLPALAVAGCAAESKVSPVSSSSRDSVGAASQEPEAPNSLPRGSAVDSPLTQRAGNVGTTRVGPATRAVTPAARSAY